MKRSAGILVYKIEDNKIKVLLCHPGGPYWQGKDFNSWSIPKGENNKKEKVIETAKREFMEETNLNITTKLEFLKSKKISRKKLAIIFYTTNDYKLDKCKSNEFEIEFPKGSGNYQKFPEMDMYEWFDLAEARNRIIKKQIFFIEQLEKILNKNI